MFVCEPVPFAVGPCDVVVGPWAAPPDVPPVLGAVAGLAGAFAAGLAAGFLSSAAAPGQMRLPAEWSESVRLNHYLIVLRADCIIISSSFQFQTSSIRGVFKLLDVADLAVREGHFHVFVIKDLFCAQLGHARWLAERRCNLILRLPNGDSRRWNVGRRRWWWNGGHWRRGRRRIHRRGWL